MIVQVASQFDIRPEFEDPTKHIRKGAHGDHVEKLRPDTITQLNEILKQPYRKFGYAFKDPV
ncbi:MAG: hypothetical protein AAF198_09885 [Pseudomonadota bacterium]